LLARGMPLVAVRAHGLNEEGKEFVSETKCRVNCFARWIWIMEAWSDKQNIPVEHVEFRLFEVSLYKCSKLFVNIQSV
jgi:hypothetical protein